tara:strand:+ start:340 stop:786 length:447 start_codon:yes stop_codon:yes gene_type:complete
MELINIINAVTSISHCNIKLKARDSNTVFCRWVYYKVAKKHTRSTLKAIGQEVNRGHDTVLYGLRNIDQVLKDERYRLLYNDTLVSMGIEAEDFGIPQALNVNTTAMSAILVDLLEYIKDLDDDTLANLLENRVKPFVKIHKHNTNTN